jgi:predicted unusual protein kinase regulating ubiquinone biosynthesis (AarF/ABC1/UbiB family)
MLLPLDVPLEQRLIMLIAQMPSLQKIGQIVARNRNLDPAFRAELSRLENAIEDITPAEIRAEVERQLGLLLETHQVELQDVILAEASVSATLRFRWLNPATGLREAGVFKVLKPYINEHFTEELELLGGLAEYFDANRRNYPLAQVDLREIFEDVRHLLKHEVDFPNAAIATAATVPAVTFRNCRLEINMH